MLFFKEGSKWLSGAYMPTRMEVMAGINALDP